MADLLNFDVALERILAAAKPLPSEIVALSKAAGRYLAAPIAAKLNQPPFNASAMDGYAVRAGEVVPGRTLPIVGVSQAGSGLAGALPAGAAARIFTGAPVPDGADAVIIQEQATAEGASVSFEKSPRPGQSIRVRGQDFAQGEVLLDVGAHLNARALSLVAAGNCAEVSVSRPPVCAILATGDELVAPGGAVSEDKIVASNSAGLRAMFETAGAAVRDAGIVGDDPAGLRTALESLLASDADVIITSGGASVGDHDLVLPTLESLGVQIGFWKIAMRPGKPLMFGQFGDKLVVGLPGNPVSALTTAFLLVVPALRALAGAAQPLHRMLSLPLAAPLPANGPRRHFLRASLEVSATGTAVRSMMETDSAHLSSFSLAEALIVHREDAAEMSAGQLIDVIPL